VFYIVYILAFYKMLAHLNF